MSTQPLIKELHVYPTYAVLTTQRPNFTPVRTARQAQNEVHLKNNNNAGVLSTKARRRLTNAVNWLIASAKDKTVYDKSTGKRFKFKVNFITLTIPTLNHSITDHEFKKVLLHAFINACRYKYNLSNYVWRVEPQANGNIHAHFTTDTFIHWRDLRTTWNRILQKHGIIQAYCVKHSNLSFTDYCNLYNSNGSRSVEQLRKAYDYGVQSNWQDPNSTDVHAVYKIKDLAAYMAKYMSKNDPDRRKIKGRLWSCSTNLSASNKLSIELLSTPDFKYLESLFSKAVTYKPIYSVNALGVNTKCVAEIFFFKLSDWGKVIKGKLLELFKDHLSLIRNNFDIFHQPPIINPVIDQPSKITIDHYQPPSYKQLVFF